MSSNDNSVRFLYSTAAGRMILKLIMKTRADRIMVWFLRSRLSRCVIPGYAKRNNIDLAQDQMRSFRTFRDFFVRERGNIEFDAAPDHLISPCDGWLSAYPIEKSSSFAVKGSHYRVCDLINDSETAERFTGGTCLILRLCASDFHHYCYIDDGFQGFNHYIPGELHSVQPIACETYPVFTLNRRCWCLMNTENFGSVVQTEIGAIVVGGISNDCENTRVRRGDEKGHFELSGSTIILLFEPDRIRLLPHIEEQLADGDTEVRVTQGMWIATAQ